MGVAPVVVALDGGGTKTDAVALTLDGDLAGRARGPGVAPQSDLPGTVALVDRLAREVAGSAPVVGAGLYLSGLDLPVEVAGFREAVADRPWAAAGLEADNDLFALLRAGTDSPDAVGVVCGTGMNALGRRADGAVVRFLAIGATSGDWGGGGGLGAEALWHAARDVDGRGPHTALTAAVADHFGVPVPVLIEDLHLGRRAHSELAGLAPAVFGCADAGDEVARALVERQADEVVAFARACLVRLDLTGAAVPVVLGGSILQARHPALDARVRAGIAAVAPSARPVVLAQPPITGAALLTLEHAGASPAALARAREALA